MNHILKISGFILIIFIAQISLAQNLKKENEMQNNFKQTIMIDLDGVLNNYTKYDENSIPEIKKGAKEFLEKLYKSEKYELVLFTTRNTLQAVKWLEENKIDKFFSNVTNTKGPAVIYIDDRALKFDGNYDKTLEEIDNFRVYWKN